MLSEEQLQALEVKHGKLGVITWTGHQLVLQRPSRAQIANFKRQADSPAEKVGATDGLCQATLVAFDGESDKVRALQLFGAFLDEFPAFTSSDKCRAVLDVLSGAVEEEAAHGLGKGATIRSATRAH